MTLASKTLAQWRACFIENKSWKAGQKLKLKVIDNDDIRLIGQNWNSLYFRNDFFIFCSIINAFAAKDNKLRKHDFFVQSYLENLKKKTIFLKVTKKSEILGPIFHIRLYSRGTQQQDMILENVQETSWTLIGQFSPK